jgi:hypothetical protein
MQVDFNFIKNFMVNSFLNIITVILIIIKKINLANVIIDSDQSAGDHSTSSLHYVVRNNELHVSISTSNTIY